MCCHHVLWFCKQSLAIVVVWWLYTRHLQGELSVVCSLSPLSLAVVLYYCTTVVLYYCLSLYLWPIVSIRETGSGHTAGCITGHTAVVCDVSLAVLDLVQYSSR